MHSAPGMVRPRCGIILGSGLGGLAEHVIGAVRIPYSELPGFPSVSVEGHSGLLVVGWLADCPVAVLSGRFHLYEGHAPSLTGFPVRVLHALGASSCVVTNAAGAVQARLDPGDLMLIVDHINMTYRNPLIGSLEHGDLRFPDMSEPCDRTLGTIMHEAARDAGLVLREGVYCGLSGPAYETPAEVRMLERLGADAIGMSTVAELIVARALGLRTVAVSCITNRAAGVSRQPLSHTEVLETARMAANRFEKLITGFVRRLLIAAPSVSASQVPSAGS